MYIFFFFLISARSIDIFCGRFIFTFMAGGQEGNSGFVLSLFYSSFLFRSRILTYSVFSILPVYSRGLAEVLHAQRPLPPPRSQFVFSLAGLRGRRSSSIPRIARTSLYQNGAFLFHANFSRRFLSGEQDHVLPVRSRLSCRIRALSRNSFAQFSQRLLRRAFYATRTDYTTVFPRFPPYEPVLV